MLLKKSAVVKQILFHDFDGQVHLTQPADNDLLYFYTVQSSTACWQKHKTVNNLPNIVTLHARPGIELGPSYANSWRLY